MSISSGISFWLATSWLEWMKPKSDLPVTSIDFSILPSGVLALDVGGRGQALVLQALPEGEEVGQVGDARSRAARPRCRAPCRAGAPRSPAAAPRSPCSGEVHALRQLALDLLADRVEVVVGPGRRVGQRDPELRRAAPCCRRSSSSWRPSTRRRACRRPCPRRAGSGRSRRASSCLPTKSSSAASWWRRAYSKM